MNGYYIMQSCLGMGGELCGRCGGLDDLLSGLSGTSAGLDSVWGRNPDAVEFGCDLLHKSLTTGDVGLIDAVQDTLNHARREVSHRDRDLDSSSLAGDDPHLDTDAVLLGKEHGRSLTFFKGRDLSQVAFVEFDRVLDFDFWVG